MFLDLDHLTRVSFLGLAMALLLLERIPGLRRTVSSVQYRWLTNVGLMLLGGIVLSALFPASITEIARTMDTGLVHNLHLPFLAEIVLVFLLLDGWRYWEHRLFHEVPLLWRTHLVHHSDTAVDVTTAERHHPLETLITTFIAFILVFSLGFSVQALGLYLLVATLSSLYTHANITLPKSIDRPLRRWLVTPSVHAIHHSDYQPQTDSNYGSVLTVWDRLFGTYTDPDVTVIPRFGLDEFRSPVDTALGPVLLQPFEYRRGRSSQECSDNTPEITTQPKLPLSPEWRQALLYGAVGLCLALLALWPTALDLTRVWGETEPYQYAWLVLPMFIYLVGWYHRDNILAMTPRPGYMGLPLVALAAILWMAAFVVDIKLGQHLALVLVLQGIALCTLGWKAYRSQLPAMLLLFLMIPCGDILLPLLRGLTVKWIEWFALFTGLPHSIEGYVIYIGEHRYVVIDLCAGLSFFTLASFLGYSFGLLLFRSLTKVLAMAALGAALGILTNAVRVCLIVGIDWQRGSQLDLAAHQGIQWLVLLTALGFLLFLASRLEHDTWAKAQVNDSAGTSVLPAARFGPALAGALMLVTVGLVQGISYRSDGTTSAAADSLQQLADRHPDSRWLGTGNADSHALRIPFSQAVSAILITPERGTGRLVENSLRPEDESIWRHTNTGRYRDCRTDSCITFVHTSWKRKDSNDTRHTFYTYYVGDMMTDSRLAFRLAQGWNRLTGSPDPAGLIGFKLRGEITPDVSLSSLYQQLRDSLHATANNAWVSSAG